MDHISEIIETLNEEDSKEFKYFLNRYRNRQDRKDLELFNLLEKKKLSKREELIGKLYTNKSQIEAYHATRKRLLKQLIEFINLKKENTTSNSDGYISSLISLSNYLFSAQKEETGWNFLNQAKELAVKGEAYGLLNQICTIQIEQSNSPFAPSLENLLSEKKKYQQLALEDDNAMIAYKVIQYELKASLVSGKEIDLDKLIKKILTTYNLTHVVSERPIVLFNIIGITRQAFLAKKDFYSFEPYVIQKYQELEQTGKFNKHNKSYQLNFLYMIAHVLYRNKKFQKAECFLNQLYETLQGNSKSHFLLFYPKYNLLLAAIYNYSGRNEEAIQLLEKMLSSKKVKLDNQQLLNTHLNLSTYYFQRGDYKKSIRVFQNVQHSDKWLTKIMGMEWVLKKSIIECINQFELGNSDIVETRLKSIQKSFADYLDRPLYRRVQTFLKLVTKLNEDPSIAATKSFAVEVESSFEFVNSEQEDIQAMTFYGWLKAKMQRRNYYEVLLELVKQ